MTDSPPVLPLVRVLVCGGRDIEDREFAFAALDALHKKLDADVIMHGACGCDTVFDGAVLKGADLLVEEWATDRQIVIERYPAPWRAFGRRAGPMRNAQMLRGEPTAVVAFPGGAGTADIVARASEGGVPVYQVGSDRRIRMVGAR